MTTEEKSKAYDEAIKVAKSKIKNDKDHVLYEDDITDIFPELTWSEGERIREDIVTYLKSVIANKGYRDKIIESWIDWLEKQSENFVCKVKIGETYKCIASPRYTCFRIGEIYHVKDDFVAKLINTCSDCFVLLEKQDEQKFIKEHDVCDTCDEKASCVNPCPVKLIEQKPIDKVEPKFKVGDTIIKKHNSDILYFGSFTITDITGGKYWYNDRIICDITEQDDWELVEQKPNDKVDQYSLPVSDDSSLPTFDESIYHPCTEEAYEQEYSEWSEEDERKLKAVISLMKSNRAVDPFYDKMCLEYWLKSLKDRVQPKQEWSEEDEQMLNQIIKDYERANESWLKGQGSLPFGNRIKWLKFLRPQSQWKPSK